MSNAPQLFHNKPDQETPYTIIPLSIIKALNTALNGNELKIMLTYLACKGDGSFAPSTEYMLQMTGIKDRANFYKARKSLIAKGYIQEASDELIIDCNRLV